MGIFLLAFVLFEFFSIKIPEGLPYAELGKIFQNKTTIILATRNEEKNIVTALESLINQNFTSYDVIITDRSTDNTLKVAREVINSRGQTLLEKNINILLIAWDTNKSLVPSKVGQLEHAFMYLTPNIHYIVYADADIYYPPTWLPCLMFGIFCGYDAVFSAIKADNKYRFLDNLDILDNQIVLTLAESALALKIRGVLIGGSTIFKRSVFDHVKGYAGIEHSLIEDAALGEKFYRYTKKIGFINDKQAYIYTKPAKNFSTQLNQKLRWTKTIWEQQNALLILLFLLASLFPLLLYSLAVISLLVKIFIPNITNIFFLPVIDIVEIAFMWFVFDSVIIGFLLYKA